MGLSFWHMLLLVGIVLLVFGPGRLPGIGRSMGEAIRGFKKGISDDSDDKPEQIKGSEKDPAAQAQAEREKNRQ